LGLPIHRGYYIEDARTAELGWWEERKCYTAFVILSGQEGTGEIRITEIPVGETLPPLKFALDELLYVLSGRGFATVWEEGANSHTFEWQDRSMFLLPRNRTHQLINAQGNAPVRLLHYNFLPVALAGIPYPDLFFNNDRFDTEPGQNIKEYLYSQASSAPSSLWRRRLVRQLLPRPCRMGQAQVTARPRGRWLKRDDAIPAQSPLCPHVHDPEPYIQEGPPPWPGFRHRHPGARGSRSCGKKAQRRYSCPGTSIFRPPSRWFH
jgi:hypothetical protein